MTWNDYALGDTYDYVSFSLTTGQTNYDVKSNQASLWNNVPNPQQVMIDTTQNITIRFNNTSFAAVNLDLGKNPMELLKKINIKNIYLTNSSGTTSTVRIWLFP